MEKLRVEISADSKSLEKEVKQAIKYLKDFEKKANEAAEATEGMGNPVKKGADGLKGLGKASANATPALLEFNRTIQDAPFGIQGVANNIQQLTANFGYLKTQTGSTRSALKAMLAGLSGPQGILLAVSLVTSLLVAFGDKLFSAKNEAEGLADATKKMAESLDKFVESQTDANRALLQGAQNAQKEVIQLNQLRQAAEDTNRSTNERLKAIKELRRLFPDYFKDLSDEQILTGNLASVYNELTTSIINRARATAATNILVKNAEKELAINARLAQIVAQIVKNKEESARIDALNTNNPSGGQVGGFSQLATANQTANLLKEGEDLRKELERILGSNFDLAKIIEDNGGIDLSGVTLDNGKPIVLRPNVDLVPTIKSFELPDFVNRGALGKQIDDALVAPLLQLPNKIDVAATRALIALNNFNDDANRIVQGSLADTFSQLGSVIGDALIQGGNVLEAVGTTILQGIGQFLSKMGRLLIEYGTLAVIKGKLDLAILTGGATAIGAGLVAIAVGTALTAAGSAFGNIANNTGGGSVGTGGSRSSGSFTSSGGGFGAGNVVFEISGTNLVGVLRRATNNNLAIG